MKPIIFLLLLSIQTTFFAQNRQEKIQSLKIAYLTDALNLTSAEAQQFWPIYNSSQKKIKELQKREQEEIFKVLNKKGETLTNSDADKLIEKQLTINEEKHKYHQELIKNLRAVLSPKKIIKLQKTERDFKKRLLKRIKPREKNRPR